MGNLNERHIEISMDEYKKLLEKGVRMDIIIQSLEQSDFVSKEDLLLLARGQQRKEEKEEQEEE